MNGFSKRLKKLRLKNGLSQKDLGIKLGIGQTSIANYEANKRVPSLEIFISIANVFNVSLDYLAGTINTNKKYISDKVIEISPEGEDYLQLLLEGKKAEGLKYILQLKNDGWQNMDIYEKIMVPLLEKTGDLWESGEIKVSEEHYISNAILDSFSHLNSLKTVDNRKDKILMATVDEEEHMIGLKIMENILVQKGYDTYFLGSKTSSDHLIEAIKLQNPKIIILSVTLQRLIVNLEQTIRSIRRKLDDDTIKIVVAGKGVEDQLELVYEFGADAYGISFNDISDIIEEWTND
jgi:methanogenic corrinoid protein MtbC1